VSFNVLFYYTTHIAILLQKNNQWLPI
jgi:hypothetical protein